MADKDLRQNGNGSPSQGHDYRSDAPDQRRTEPRRTDFDEEREVPGRTAEQGSYYQAAMERSWRADDDRMERTGRARGPGGGPGRGPGRGPEFDRDRDMRVRDRGYESMGRDPDYDGDYTSRTGREEYEHAREGFRYFGTPSRSQGREIRDPYNTRNWDGGFEGRDTRVAGRSGHAYAPDETSVPEEEWWTEQRRRGRGVFEEEPLTARDVMTHSPRAVRREAPLRDVAQIMKDENCGVVPVVTDQDRLIGLITDRDMVMRTFRNDGAWTQVRVREVMTEDVEAVTPDEPLHLVVRLMGRKHIRRVPVVDRGDRLLGMISMTDIAQKAQHDESLQEAMVKVARRRSFWSKLWT